MADLGFAWSGSGKQWGGVVDAIDPEMQTRIGEVRKAGLNIMMSMKSEGKPVSFVEDCAVDLPDLAEFTAELTDVFNKHGTPGTWYAHASVGCLHVHPVLNLKLEKDANTARKVAIGMPVTRHPSRRSQRALLTHWAPASGTSVEALIRVWMSHVYAG